MRAMEEVKVRTDTFSEKLSISSENSFGLKRRRADSGHSPSRLLSDDLEH